jgi:N-acetyl-gamma-glutamyl-phosphate reductase
MSNRVRAIVVGATGYSGRDLIGLLLNHPHFELIGAFASSEAAPLAAIHPQLTGLTQLDCLPYDQAAIARLEPDLIFLATPNEFSHEVVPALLENFSERTKDTAKPTGATGATKPARANVTTGINREYGATGTILVDLSGAFRLRDAALYPKYYGFEHKRPDLLQQAVYGLTEFVREQLKNARLIANPGCYPTSILIPVIPLVKADLVDDQQPVICDSKSGVTGAGKSPASTTHFVEVSESFRAYNVFRHRHTPEIAQVLGLHGESLIFTPHLLPINRGILSTIYIRLKKGVSRRDILKVWQGAFESDPYVRVFDGPQLPEIKFVANTPFCDIGCAVDEVSGQAIIVSAIDNLLKGAASQAVQNANIAFGFDERAGMR